MAVHDVMSKMNAVQYLVKSSSWHVEKHFLTTVFYKLEKKSIPKFISPDKLLTEKNCSIAFHLMVTVALKIYLLKSNNPLVHYLPLYTAPQESNA